MEARAEVMSLAGEWRFQLDAENEGVEKKWFAQRLEDTISLPGTTDEAKKGPGRDERPEQRLARPWGWIGPAWYQREVEIPDSWAGKRVALFLERTKHTSIWIDGEFVGWDNTLSAPHVHEVTAAMTPGKHTITLLVDNSKLPPVGPAHQVDERTQTNWNGIVGVMELRATDRVWIEDAQAYPDAAETRVMMRVVVGNASGKAAQGKMTVTARTTNTEELVELVTQVVDVKADSGETVVEFIYEPGDDVPLWDEFNPSLIAMKLELETKNEAASYADDESIQFGMMNFETDRNRFEVNGSVTFLRGRIDSANYPLTGYAPMAKDEWLRILSILKNDWGLNHVRFHSWCPPIAAFQAADELGVYLQPELPNKRSGFNAPENEDAAFYNIDRLDVETTDEKVNLYDYGKREGELILRHFGNHPSFVMFTLGNELGRNQGMYELVAHFKELDPRHLYAQGSNNMHWKPSLAEGDDFWVIGKVGDDVRPVRGSYYMHDYRHGAVNSHPPGTLDDFTRSIEGVPVPVVGHETGQYQVYPDFRDIEKFTGVLRAENYKMFRERLKAAGMLDQANDFVRASGALAAICYREDIELALRTPGLGGIQLLDIMDFPGQGTALVGMLNVFMESKGVIEAEKWRQFTSEVVPLLRTKKLTWTSDEIFTGRLEVAHYGAKDMPSAVAVMTIKDGEGKLLTEHETAPRTLAQGDLHVIDQVAWPLSEVKTPQKLMVNIRLKGTEYQNSYPIWVYPPEVDTTPAKEVMVSRRLNDEATQAHLDAGGKVLLLPVLDELPHSVPGAFQTEFWSPMFARSAAKRGLELPPGTLGLLMDPEHPALAHFPTEFHSNWQWWHVVKNSRPLMLDDTPDDYRPIVQVIDNFDRNHKLGILAETKVGKGSMLICPVDLPAIQDQPEGRQFLHSLLRYMESDAFAPQVEIDPGLLEKLLPGLSVEEKVEKKE